MFTQIFWINQHYQMMFCLLQWETIITFGIYLYTRMAGLQKPTITQRPEA